MSVRTRTTALWIAAAALVPRPATAQLSQNVVRDYLWPVSQEAHVRAAAIVESDPAWVGLSLEQARRLETWIRRGRDRSVARVTGGVLHELVVATPGDREAPTLVRLPGRYTPDRPWPLLLAMHGGPPGSVAGALQGALGMIRVWAEAADSAGWIVAAPAMVDVVSRAGRTQDRLPYEIFQPEEARAVLDSVRARFRVDPDRIVATGISLGSNFSIAYAAAHPDWFAAIVPVSTEGESREWLLRNLRGVPTYVLEGARDRNIRGSAGRAPWTRSCEAWITTGCTASSRSEPTRASRSTTPRC